MRKSEENSVETEAKEYRNCMPSSSWKRIFSFENKLTVRGDVKDVVTGVLERVLNHCIITLFCIATTVTK